MGPTIACKQVAKLIYANTRSNWARTLFVWNAFFKLGWRTIRMSIRRARNSWFRFTRRVRAEFEPPSTCGFAADGACGTERDWSGVIVSQTTVEHVNKESVKRTSCK